MRTLLSAVVAAMLAMCTIGARADGPSERQVALVIESKTLAEALDEWARQTGYRILVRDWQLTKDLPAPTLKGTFDPPAALDKLLNGTPLTWALVNKTTVVVRKKAPSPPKERTGWNHDSPVSRPAQRPEVRARDGPEEVIVTAQRRTQNLTEVPIGMTVLGGAELDSFTGEGVSEALSLVHGLSTTPSVQGGGSQLAVRGVAAGGPLFSGSSPIAYYLDFVPFGLIKSAITPDSNAYDLERIEVLRGPQGTLYGASAQNGVVRVLTKDASPDYFELKARTSLSSTAHGSESYRGDVAVNVPVIEGKLGIRAVAGYQDQGGWIDRPTQDDANDAQIGNFRFKIAAQPTDNLSIALSAWLSRSDYSAPSLGDDERQHSTTLDESISADYDLLGLRFVYLFADLTLTSTTGYIDYENGSALGLASLGMPEQSLFTGLDSEVISQEVVLSSANTQSWRWSLGAMYRDGEDRLLQEAVFFPVPIDFSDRSESLAVFGELTRMLADGRFEITAGLRYFEDEVTQIENVPQSANPGDATIRDSETFTKTSPRVVLAWHPVPNATLYTSYAEGFRSGFNQNANIIRVAPDFPPLQADTLATYELGAKDRLADGMFSYDAAVYYIDWHDIQQSVTVNINHLPITVLVNGQSASGLGFEFACNAQPTNSLSLGLNFSWNDLTMDGDTVSEGVLLFEEGDRLNYSPEYIIGTALDYEFPLGNRNLKGRFSISGNYMSKQSTRSIHDGALARGTGDSLLIGRASLALRARERWTAMLFVDNFNDENGSPIRGAGAQPADGSQRVRPRTLGLQLEYNF